MKKPILILLLLIFSSTLLFSQVTSNGAGGGAWNDPATWSSNTGPGTSDDVVIVAGDTVTVGSTQSCKGITIDDSGTLKITTGAVLNTSYTVTVNGTLTMDDGNFNIGGTSKTKYLEISGGTLNFSGGAINVSGRYKQLSGGNSYFSGDAVLNLATAGEQSNNGTINIFSVTTKGTFSVASGSTVQIVLKNENGGSTPEIHYSPGTSDFNGGSIILENASSVPNIDVDGDEPIYKLQSNIGSGDTLHFSRGSQLQINNFTIQSGKAVADAGAMVSINGTASLGADGNFSFEVNANDAASVYFANAPAKKVKADISLIQGKFHYISAPVTTSQTFDNLNLGLTGGSGNDSFYYWDESLEYKGVTGNWVDILNGADGTGTHSTMNSDRFQTAKGYTIHYQHADHTMSLTGNVLAADQTIAVTSTSGSTGQGWNLVGNPFTASIFVTHEVGTNNFLDVNASILDSVDGGIYLWNEKSSFAGNRNDYLTVSNASGRVNISVGQAFMVKVKASGDISFPQNIQNNDREATFYKDNPVNPWVRCWFDLSRNGQVRSETLIAFGPGMTQGLDPTYDAGLLRGNSNEYVFTKLVKDDGNDFAIQALPPLAAAEKVKVGLDADSTGDYVLSLARNENLADSVSVVLKDEKTGQLIDLQKNKAYSFSLDKTGEIKGRFTLYFNQKVTGTSSFKASEDISPVEIKVIRHQVDVNNLEQRPIQCTLEVVDELGQRLMTQKLNLAAGGHTSVRMPEVKGLMIISLFNNTFRKTEKVIF